MDPSQHLILTDIALRAARDCRSRKVKRRLKAAMQAVLAPEYRDTADEETLLMGALAGVLRVVDDMTGEYLQKELYGLGRISSLIAMTPEGEAPSESIMREIENDMPPESARVGILVLWEAIRNENGIFRVEPGDIDLPPLDLPPPRS